MKKMSVFARKLCSAIVSDGLTFPVLQRGQSSGIGLHFFFLSSLALHTIVALFQATGFQKRPRLV